MSKIQIEAIGQIAVPVADLQRATAFYRNVLGLPFLFNEGDMAFFDCGNVRLMLGLNEEGAGRSSIVYYRVPDLDAAYAALREGNAVIRQEPELVARMPDHELWMLFLEDSEGNVVALMSTVETA